MTFARVALSIVILLSSVAGSGAQEVVPIEATGYGPFRVGMEPVEVATKTGTPLKLDFGFWEPKECFMVRPANGPPGLRIMVTNGTIARVEVNRPGISTNEGVHVGTSERELRNLYGNRLRWGHHEYDDRGHYVELLTDRHAIVFETDGNKVTLIRAGRLPEARYIEHCL